MRNLSELALTAVTHAAPVPGLSLVLNKRFRRTVRKAAGVALIGAGALVAVPLALYVICRTSGESTEAK
ncbi:MAG TPA: hypothetical protein VE961_06715 [Pyrinomonadaceae bacterium]|nr:hypothetical protein [Pyrinomonadaceae bacterium]